MRSLRQLLVPPQHSNEEADAWWPPSSLAVLSSREKAGPERPPSETSSLESYGPRSRLAVVETSGHIHHVFRVVFSWWCLQLPHCALGQTQKPDGIKARFTIEYKVSPQSLSTIMSQYLKPVKFCKSQLSRHRLYRSGLCTEGMRLPHSACDVLSGRSIKFLTLSALVIGVKYLRKSAEILRLCPLSKDSQYRLDRKVGNPINVYLELVLRIR